MGGKVFWIASKCLETSGIERHDKMLLLDDQWLTQIQVVAPGGPSNVAKGRLNVRKFTTLPTPGGDPTMYSTGSHPTVPWINFGKSSRASATLDGPPGTTTWI